MDRNLPKLLHSGRLGDEDGASALEYGLIAGLVAVVLVGVLTTTGTSLTSLFERVSSAVSDAAESSSTPSN